MPQKDYRAYCQTPSGQAARARAKAKYIKKRREERAKPSWRIAPLLQAISNWRNS